MVYESPDLSHAIKGNRTKRFLVKNISNEVIVAVAGVVAPKKKPTVMRNERRNLSRFYQIPPFFSLIFACFTLLNRKVPP